MRIVSVIKKHTSEFSIPLTIMKDDTIEGERRETEWGGWLWCKNDVDIFGWVPEPYLKKLPEDRKYIALRDYNAIELSVDIGQELMVLDEASSWAWVRTSQGDEGWVPLENLENVTKSDSIPDLM